MLKKKQTSDILIIGSGAAGLSLALLLAKLDLRIHIVESAPKLPTLSSIKPTGRTVALMRNSLNILQAAGLSNAFIQDYGGPLSCMRIIDDSIKNLSEMDTLFNANDIDMQEYGFNIPNGALVASLADLAKKQKNINLLLGTKFMSSDKTSSNITAHLDNGMQITASLMIGADGRNSAVRTEAGIQTWEKDYPQTAMTFLISHTYPHNNTATEFHRPAGPMALVPLPGNQSSIVWVETPEKAEQLTRLKKQDIEQIFQDKTNNILGEISIESAVESWPLKTIKAESYTAPRTALIAEAAHVMSPITAQGLNLSLRDVAALAEEIADTARLGLDIGSDVALRTYEHRRKTDIESRVGGVDAMNRIVSNDIRPIQLARRIGFKTLDAVKPLKKFAMRQGLAPPIDEGRLARGEAL